MDTRKAHIMSFSDKSKKLVNTTFRAIIWPDGKKVYITLHIKGKMKGDYDLYRLAFNHLENLCETFSVWTFPKQDKALGLTLTFTITEDKK